jgi:arabinose-5-phosphate isomerase
MTASKDILNIAKEVLELEAEAISDQILSLNQSFVKAVEAILACKGRVIIIAIGKSGHIGRKIAATLASTGTPSLYVHPSEALHGDLGMITSDDVILALSHSGESEELNTLLPIVRKIGAKILCMTGKEKSTLARLSDIVITVKIKKEADPNNLAPTTSTTATLAMGDALAVALIEKRKFTARDFALLHPGGNIGRSFIQVKDIMHTGESNPVVNSEDSLKNALITITSKGLGVTSVVNRKNKLIGILTDGDVRRILLNSEDSKGLFELKVKNIMTKDPITVKPDLFCSEAVQIMEDNRKHRLITVIPVVDSEDKPVGMIHIHDLIRRGFSFKKDSELNNH